VHRLIGTAYVIALVLFCLLQPTASSSATLTGQTVRPGATLDVRFPISQYFQDYAASGGNQRLTTGRAVISFPKGFDPTRTWPILIISATSDPHHTNISDARWYQEPATAENWVVLASEATIEPHTDSISWRLGIMGAALDTIHKEWPQSAHWPVAFAGISGGAKWSGILGTMLAKTGAVKICGFFLTGINDDRLSAAYDEYRPSPDFLNTPIWLSSGTNDPIAPFAAQERVRTSLEHTGFKHVRLETFLGRHQVNPAQLQLALRWFRQVGRF
jgi:hypothetical protein